MTEYIMKSSPILESDGTPIEVVGELIRCKDCKHYGTDMNRMNCNVFCCSMPENGFCSMGERK